MPIVCLSGGSPYIDLVDVVGNLEADIINNYGPVYFVNVTGSILGDSGDPVSIIAVQQIFEVTAADMQHVEIRRPTVNDVLKVDLVESQADFVGAIECSQIKTLRVESDFDGSLETDLIITIEPNPQRETRIRIGDSLTATSIIRLRSSGSLEPQVTINNNATTTDPPTHFWLGDVEVNQVTLSGVLPQYQQLSLPLGGGAVGEVPYWIHGWTPSSASSTPLPRPSSSSP